MLGALCFTNTISGLTVASSVLVQFIVSHSAVVVSTKIYHTVLVFFVFQFNRTGCLPVEYIRIQLNI